MCVGFASIFLQESQVFSSKKGPFVAGKTAFVQISVYQDNIVADAADALPGNDEFVMPAKEAEAFAVARNDDGYDAAIPAVHLHVTDKTEAAAVADIDDLFTFEGGKAVPHDLTYLFIL